MNQNVYVFIMAGGGGSRFWPLSKKVKPKQFLSITKDGESMIQMTAKRASLFTKNKVHVLTNKMYEQIVKEHLGDVDLILEPVAKNTAAPIGLAACYILKQNKDAIMMIWPSDHVILNTDNFKETFDEAINLAQSRKCLVTVGIKPEYPHTGYGYIKLSEHLENNSYIVEKFVEKPNYEVAKGYVESGNYLWNSGMFVWRADVILNAIKDYMPDLYNKLMVISDAIGTQNERKVIDDYFPTLEYDIDKDLRKAYKGGFTYLNPIYKEKDVENITVLDVNSLYPSVMYEKKLPFGEPLFFNGKYEDDKVYNLYIQMITCSFKIKKNKIPTIQIKHNLNYKSNEYLESSNR